MNERLLKTILELYSPSQASLKSYAFELATAVVYILLGASNLIYPGDLIHTPVGRNVGGFATLWSFLFIVGGAGVSHGILKPFVPTRVVGLILLATGITMQTVTAVAFNPTPRAIAPAVFAAACIVRALTLFAMVRRVEHASRA